MLAKVETITNRISEIQECTWMEYIATCIVPFIVLTSLHPQFMSMHVTAGFVSLFLDVCLYLWSWQVWPYLDGHRLKLIPYKETVSVYFLIFCLHSFWILMHYAGLHDELGPYVYHFICNNQTNWAFKSQNCTSSQLMLIYSVNIQYVEVFSCIFSQFQ